MNVFGGVATHKSFQNKSTALWEHVSKQLNNTGNEASGIKNNSLWTEVHREEHFHSDALVILQQDL